MIKVNYIILDLEWNTSFSKKHKKYINEIIEIGAVKLDESYNIIDEFQAFVCSQLATKMHSHFTGLTGITNDEMKSGIPFEKAISEYSEWAGNDCLTLSWSNTDLYVLLDNMRYFLDIPSVPCIKKYADLQKIVQSVMNITGNQISLSAAAELMNLDITKYCTHRAVGDCMICADMMKVLGNKCRPDKFSVITDKKYFASMIRRSKRKAAAKRRARLKEKSKSSERVAEKNEDKENPSFRAISS